MIVYKTIQIDAKDENHELVPARQMSREEAEQAVVKLVDTNMGRRSFMDVADPTAVKLTYADDPDGVVDHHIFSGPLEEIHRLKIFAMNYKSAKKRQENIRKN